MLVKISLKIIIKYLIQNYTPQSDYDYFEGAAFHKTKT